MIDSRSIIDPSAKIAENVEISAYSVIGPGVEIGEGTSIGSHVVINSNTKIGRNNKIHAFVALGGDPQHTHYKGESTYLEIGDNNIIREFCTLNRGTSQGGGVTRVGSRNYFMAYAHIAHDCIVGNDIILANNASLAGHVIVEDFAVFGAFCAAHQFVKIGAHSFLGRTTKIGQDIPPFVLVTGVPGAPVGINAIGLKRRGFSDKSIRCLRRAYIIVYRRGLMLKDAIEQISGMVDECPEIQSFIEALKYSKRGVARLRKTSKEVEGLEDTE
ncbi:MAG TPA: acyl-ACP--UDP-N-acetylglucosamine O-acyltransferase [Gammaproteobacteria bacterium]|nr:acyl-ACP--UDP-N-acetylglucosamine O-acyltransferase [Gammaproteobacteria bacterium]